jgi:hypothetical protein
MKHWMPNDARADGRGVGVPRIPARRMRRAAAIRRIDGAVQVDDEQQPVQAHRKILDMPSKDASARRSPYRRARPDSA